MTACSEKKIKIHRLCIHGNADGEGVANKIEIKW